MNHTTFLKLSFTNIPGLRSNFLEFFLETNSPDIVFGAFNVHDKDWCIYSGETDRPEVLFHHFSISNDLAQIVNFFTPMSDCDSQSYCFRLLSSDLSICSTVAFPALRNCDHVAASVSLAFLSNSKNDGPSHCTAYVFSRADWGSLRDHLKDTPWKDIFKLGALNSVAAALFCEWVQVGIDAYITQREYQAKTHKDHFFRLYQQNRSSASKVNFCQSSNTCQTCLCY